MFFGVKRCLNLPCPSRYAFTGFFFCGANAMSLLGVESSRLPLTASQIGNTQDSTDSFEYSMVFAGSLLQPLGHGAKTCRNAGPSTSKPLRTFVSMSFQ